MAAALARTEPGDPAFDSAAFPADLAAFANGAAQGRPPLDAELMALINGTQTAEPRVRARAQAAALLALALESPLTPDRRGLMAGLSLPEGKAPLGRNLALESAARQRLMGEAALLSLWACADAGPAGPVIGDRARIVQALHAVGLEADARAFALEGLVALK